VNGLSALSLTYSGNGNIASKADLGSYIYNPVKKNAVDSIINDPLATQPTFQQLVSYTSFNKAHTIEDESNGYDYQIIYAPDNQRVKSILSDSLGWERTRYYFGSYEKDSTASGVKHTWYINSPYGLVAVYVKENTTETLYYAETDHLGSLVALRNTNGTVVESYSYDPWGRRRNPSNWSYTNVPEPVITNRGFTGHEHLEKFNLIDMNGRVYDPVTAGFLSPDPFVTNPYFSQSYNSYSYCVNNPLKFTDPSGYVQVDMMSIFDPGQIAVFLENYINSNGDLDLAMNKVTWISQEGNYNTITREIEFWITYGGPDGGAAILTEYGYMGTANVMSRQISITLQPKDAYIFQNELYPSGQGVNYNDQYAGAVEKLAGKPYVLGADGPKAYDCSSTACYGLRTVANSKFGDYTAHDLYEKFSVPSSSKTRGSVIFYDYTSDGRIDHITTILNSSNMLHPSSGAGVLQIKPINYLDSYTKNRGGTIYYRDFNWLIINKTP
jgi:RHS repeat-associated protein